MLEKQDLRENTISGRKFKDKCDLCNTFNSCKGYNGKVLCESCIQKQKQESKINLIKKEEQLTIFDLI